MNQRRGGLGRGLAALIPPGERGTAQLQDIPLSAISPNPRQPRGVFDEEELEGLATSIRDIGLLQPIVVRPLEDERYELVAGERRLRAAKMAGLTTIPAVVRETDDEALLKEALVENIHRVQLNPLEEAAAYSQLLDDFGFTQEELADRLGKSRPTISNSLRLLSLPPAVQRKVAAGVLTAGHAKALLALDERSQQERFAERIVNEGLSVRATEEMVRLQLLDSPEPSSGSEAGGSGGGGASTARRQGRITAPGLVDLQRDLSDALQARVKISMGARTGKLQIQFGSVDDLERIVGVIARGLQTDIPVEKTDNA
ncbi:MAG: ParB/RepB/Spo0J family partition protein [Nitriliruptorales bacterium]|nr:ParB/RepB/Spo0J family partition protein [Nitriliruptorales bacterium]